MYICTMGCYYLSKQRRLNAFSQCNESTFSMILSQLLNVKPQRSETMMQYHALRIRQEYTLRKGICGKDLGKRGTALADVPM